MNRDLTGKTMCYQVDRTHFVDEDTFYYLDIQYA